MKRVIIAASIGLLLAATAVFSYLKGRTDVWISEFKVYDANLIKMQHFETNASPELREFMKSRYYHLANKIPESWLGSPYDYGQVETNTMHFVAGKDDTGPRYDYQLFKAKPLIFRDPSTGKQMSATP